MLSEITPLVLTFNEAPNIERTLAKLTWAREIIVLDSYSTDATEAICRRFPNVKFLQRPFDSFAGQCNAGLEFVSTEWVLSLDADYVLTDPLLAEIGQLPPDGPMMAYIARFRYCVSGHPLRGTLYPPRPILFRTARGRYLQDGHAHRLTIDGRSKQLQGYVWHDDRKPLARWLSSQQSYARIEAEKLSGDPVRRSLADRLRRWIWPAAPAAFFYTLLVKGCLFDGWPGWHYVFQRTYFEVLLSLELLDRQLATGDTSSTVTPLETKSHD